MRFRHPLSFRLPRRRTAGEGRVRRGPDTRRPDLDGVLAESKSSRANSPFRTEPDCAASGSRATTGCSTGVRRHSTTSTPREPRPSMPDGTADLLPGRLRLDEAARMLIAITEGEAMTSVTG